MTLRLAGLAALALLSSACTYRLQSPPPQAAVLDYSDHEYYDRPFAADPVRPSTSAVAAASEAGSTFERETAAATSSARDAGALGFTGGAARPTTIEAESTEYEEVEATPGTACYKAALEAGITRGTCTLVVERKYLLVGEQAN